MKRIVAIIAVASLVMCLVGCADGASEKKTIQAGGMTISYPSTWEEPISMDGGEILGVRAVHALMVKPSEASKSTAVAVADASDSDLKADTLKKMLVDKAGLVVEDAQIDGRSVIKASGEAKGMKISAIVAHDDGKLLSMMVETVSASDYEKDGKVYDEIMNEVQLS